MKIAKKNIIVVNKVCPEMNYLACGLSESGLLSWYFRPYANQERDWEKLLCNLPLFKNIYNRTFGRRVLPPGLEKSKVKEIGAIEDILISFLKFFFGKASYGITNVFESVLDNKLKNKAADSSIDADIIIGSYHMSELAFTNTAGIKVLNYPSAHHHWQKKLFCEEKEYEPEFSTMLSPNWNQISQKVLTSLDQEVSMADKLLLGSNFAKKTFLECGVQIEKIHVVPYGTNTSIFYPNNDKPKRDNKFNVLFVGRLGQFKGISYLLKAYHKFKRPESNLTLIGNVVGDSLPLLPYRDDFCHIRHLPQNELSSQYRSADVFVFPSLMEGMGLVVLEAMASGLPVITTPNGPGDLVRDGIDGFVVPIRSIDAIVEKLEFLYSHPHERLQMGINARNHALKFSWDCYKSRILDFLSPFVFSSDNN